METKKAEIKWVFTGIVIFLSALIMLIFPFASNGAKIGISTCLTSLIPSLFPFMILSSFVSLTPLSHYISKLLAPLTTNIFHLSGKYSTPLFFSLIGGYPIGARILSDMLSRGETSEKSIERMLCFCVNCGPAFLIGIVGIGIFQSAEVGIILLVSQIFSSFIIAALTAPNKIVAKKYYEPPISANIHTALVESITKSTLDMLTICGFVVAFMSIISALDGLGIITFFANILANISFLPFIDGNVAEIFFAGIIEVTTGIFKASKLTDIGAISTISFITGFGGISVFCQVASCFKGYRINYKPFIISRFVNGFLSLCITLILLKLFPIEINVMAYSSPPQAYVNANCLIYTICMITMCSMLILSASCNTAKKRN
ncbi:MAG: hypothetical protein RSF40_04110 [Oscillospiraceae bacterium]